MSTQYLMFIYMKKSKNSSYYALIVLLALTGKSDRKSHVVHQVGTGLRKLVSDFEMTASVTFAYLLPVVTKYERFFVENVSLMLLLLFNWWLVIAGAQSRERRR